MHGILRRNKLRIYIYIHKKQYIIANQQLLYTQSRTFEQIAHIKGVFFFKNDRT